jgi:hypothetical protein
MAFNHDIDMIDYEKSKEFCNLLQLLNILFQYLAINCHVKKL